MRRMAERPETFSDTLLAFAVPARDARGRVVRLDGVLNDVLSAHDYPPPIAHLLAEALVVVTLMGGLLKKEGSQVTIQAQTKGGPVRLLVCDYRDGGIRGYVDFDRDRVGCLGSSPALSALFGEGYLALTFDIAEDVRQQGIGKDGTHRYQGIVPLEGDSLTQACQAYFTQSEQVPTLMRVAIAGGAGGYRAGGLLVQHLPDGEEGRERLHVRLDHPEWEHIAALAGSIKHEELLDADLSLETLVWRLFHEESEVRVLPGAAVGKGCRCSVDHYAQVLRQFSDRDRDEMRNDAGYILVDCAFCSQQFAIA